MRVRAEWLAVAAGVGALAYPLGTVLANLLAGKSILYPYQEIP